MLILGACSVHHNDFRVDKSLLLTENEIIELKKSELLREHGVLFTVELLSKEENIQYGRVVAIDGSVISWDRIPGAYTYTFNIIDPDGVTATATYRDPYYHNDRFVEAELSDNYQIVRASFNQRNMMESILNAYVTDFVFETRIDVNLFPPSPVFGFQNIESLIILICSSDINIVKGVIDGLNDAIVPTLTDSSVMSFARFPYTTYNLFVIQDKTLFESILQNGLPDGREDEFFVLSEVFTNLAGVSSLIEIDFSDRGFNEDMFYSYVNSSRIVFVYQAEPNSVRNNSSVFRVLTYY